MVKQNKARLVKAAAPSTKTENAPPAKPIAQAVKEKIEDRQSLERQARAAFRKLFQRAQ